MHIARLGQQHTLSEFWSSSSASASQTLATLRSGRSHVFVDLTAVCDIAIISRIEKDQSRADAESAPEAVAWADAQREGQQMRSCSVWWRTRWQMLTEQSV